MKNEVQMSIEEMLRQDFSALAARLRDDAFIERTLRTIRGAERLRLIAVGGAGCAGAAVAASQFSALAGSLSQSLPALANVAIADSALALNLGEAPVMLTALLFALAGGVTAAVFTGAR